jgi:hypothetical protein
MTFKYVLEGILVVILVLAAVSTLPGMVHPNDGTVSILFGGFGVLCALGAIGIVYRWFKK